MLTIADEGGRGVSQKLTIADEGGGGFYEPPILADVICEQPLSVLAKYFFTFILRMISDIILEYVCRGERYCGKENVTELEASFS